MGWPCVGDMSSWQADQRLGRGTDFAGAEGRAEAALVGPGPGLLVQLAVGPSTALRRYR